MTATLAEQAGFLKNQLEKPAEDSKKWKAMMIGLKGIGGMFLIGVTMFALQPSLASQIATLVQFGLTAWGGIVSIYLGAQGTVEYKTTAALQQVNENKKVEEKRDIHETIEIIRTPRASHFDGDDIP